MDVTAGEARQLLAEADSTQEQVRARAPREHLVFLGWALFILVSLPPFDFVNPKIWGPVITVAAVIGTLITTRYFRQRGGIRPAGRSPWWSWLAFSPWYGLMVIGAELTHSRLGWAWTLAAIGAALPLVVLGLRVGRRTS